MTSRLSRTFYRKAFSVAEVLIVIAILGILSAVALVGYKNLTPTTGSTKLTSDVASLNRSVSAYLTSGGDLSSAETVQDVLDRLKTEAADQSVVPGFSGSFIDQRLEAIPMAADEVNQAIERVVWNDKEQRLVVTTAALNGAKGFRLNAALATSEPAKEKREVRFVLASQNSWIWDHKDVNGNWLPAPNPMATEDVAESGPPPSVAPRSQLQPPMIHTPGGAYSYDQYPMFVTIVNPNHSQASQLMYTVNGGQWLPYLEPISVQPNQEISTFVQATTAEHFSSLTTSASYTVAPQTFAGWTDGEFHSATGPPNLRQIYGDGYFEWGTPSGNTRGSFLEFGGAYFEEITADEFFYLGSLTFFNSVISAGTGEGSNPNINNKVILQVDLNLMNPEHKELFDFELEMINTLNHPSYSADEQADYVFINNPINDFSTLLNGKQYALELSFAYTGNQGYSTVDTFHVHEGAETSADLIGRFVEMALED